MADDTAPADLVVTGGRIRTQDPQRPWAQALAVRAGQLVAVGSAADVTPFTGPDTEVRSWTACWCCPASSTGTCT